MIVSNKEKFSPKPKKRLKSLYCPLRLDAASMLAEKERKHVDKYVFFLHKLYLSRVLDTRLTKFDYIPMHFDLLCKYVSARRANTIVDFWITVGVVETDNQYIVNEKSKGYRFTAAYRELPCVQVRILDSKFEARMNELRNRNNAKLDLSYPAHQFLHFNLHELRIDTSEAQATAFSKAFSKGVKTGSEKKGADLFTRYSIAIDSIATGDFWILRDSTSNRIHNNFVVTSRDIKPHCYIETGEELRNVDVRNSQPLLLAVLLRKEFGSAMPADATEYIYQCEQGMFYETVATKLGIAIEDRKAFKQRFFKNVLYNKNVLSEGTTEFGAFRELYPSVAAFVLRYKAQDYTKLSIALQRIESEIIIDTVIQGIATEYQPEHYFALTIHDLIVTTQSNVEDVKDRMLKAFEKYGVTPSLDDQAL